MKIGKIKIGKRGAKIGMLISTVGLGTCLYIEIFQSIEVPLIAIALTGLELIAPGSLIK